MYKARRLPWSVKQMRVKVKVLGPACSMESALVNNEWRQAPITNLHPRIANASKLGEKTFM